MDRLTLVGTADYFRLAAQQLGILPVPDAEDDGTMHGHAKAHNVTAMRCHVLEQQCEAFIEVESGVLALRCLLNALERVDAKRRELMDRR